MNLVPRPPLHDVTDEQVAAYFLSLVEGNNPNLWSEYTSDVISSGRTNCVILRNLKLDEKKFIGFKFKAVFFIDCRFDNCEFNNCDLASCRLQDTEIISSTFQGCTITSLENCIIAIRDSTLKNCIFDRTKCPESKFHACTMENVEFLRSDFNKSKFINCKSSNLSFKDTNLTDADFGETEIKFLSIKNSATIGVSFNKAKLSTTKFSGQNFIQANFSEADLQQTLFSDCQLEIVNFYDADLSGAQFFSNIDRSSFRGSNLEGAYFCDSVSCKFSSFDKANLKKVKFSFVDFERCSFVGATLIKANLYKSLFNQCNFDKCKIDKYSLAFVERDNIGASDRMVMDIIDDSEKLRLGFSGIWSVGHIVALIFFLLPYAWFVIENWAIAQFSPPSDDNITLIRALLIYIYNGGQEVESNQFKIHWSFGFAILLLAYNLLRFILLIKTKTIEHEHAITEKPSAFSFDDRLYGIKWGSLYAASRWLFVAALFIAIVNFWHFMTRSIPLSVL